MLEKITKEELDELRKQEGEDHDSLEIATLAIGRLIRVTTVSGNDYFYEIIDPSLSTAHVLRCEARKGTVLSAGYQGERIILPDTFRVGGRIIHEGSGKSSITSFIRKIALLK